MLKGQTHPSRLHAMFVVFSFHFIYGTICIVCAYLSLPCTYLFQLDYCHLLDQNLPNCISQCIKLFTFIFNPLTFYCSKSRECFVVVYTSSQQMQFARSNCKQLLLCYYYSTLCLKYFKLPTGERLLVRKCL